MSEISKLAVVDESAQLGANVKIGPFCVVGPNVVIGDGCVLMNHVTLDGHTTIGAGNVFYPNAVIGTAPQDLKYNGAPTETIIGSQNVFREYCTVHRGTELGGGKTIIGDGNLFMVAAHIAHDCVLEDGILMGNETLLAGHVKIERGAVIMALAGAHHFVTIGRYSYIGAMTPIRRDVPPFMKFEGDPNAVRAVNDEGLKRNNFSEADREQIKQAFRALFRKIGAVSVAERLDEFEAQDSLGEHAQYLCQFMRRSAQSRFGRYLEVARRDTAENRRSRKPLEVRDEQA